MGKKSGSEQDRIWNRLVRNRLGTNKFTYGNVCSHTPTWKG